MVIEHEMTRIISYIFNNSRKQYLLEIPTQYFLLSSLTTFPFPLPPLPKEKTKTKLKINE